MNKKLYTKTNTQRVCSIKRIRSSVSIVDAEDGIIVICEPCLESSTCGKSIMRCCSLRRIIAGDAIFVTVTTAQHKHFLSFYFKGIFQTTSKLIFVE